MNLSSSAIQDIPVVKPPAGVISNFNNPESRAPLFIALSALCLAIMWPIFALRLYTKTWILRSFAWDDGASIVAIALTTALAGSMFYTLTVLGTHGWDLRVVSITPAFSRTLILGISVLYGPAIFFAKLSILLLYLRTFGSNRALRILSYLGIATNLAVYTGISFAYGYLCVPRPSETWLQSLGSDRCVQHSLLPYLQGVFGVVSDMFIWILPLPVIWKLHMPLRKKVGVSIIFGTGFLAVVASAFGLYYRNLEEKAKDPIWNSPTANFFWLAESALGVACGCMPYLAPFWRHPSPFAESVKRFFTRIATSSAGTESPADVHMAPVGKPKSASINRANYVGTNVPESIQGQVDCRNGMFLKPGAFGIQRTIHMSVTSSHEDVNVTYRNNLE